MSAQTSLFDESLSRATRGDNDADDGFESHRLARTTDPATSHAAAAAAKDIIARHHNIIVAALREHGPMGKDGIAARTALTGVAVARRTIELQRAGLIRWTGRLVASAAGRAEREWAAA